MNEWKGGRELKKIKKFMLSFSMLTKCHHHLLCFRKTVRERKFMKFIDITFINNFSYWPFSRNICLSCTFFILLLLFLFLRAKVRENFKIQFYFFRKLLLLLLLLCHHILLWIFSFYSLNCIYKKNKMNLQEK
jgi:hypothetical protein